MIDEDKIAAILEKFPFLSYGVILETQYIGIILNADSQLLSIYVLDAVPDELRREFLACGEEWWWGSNRQIPINIFLKEKMRPFRPYLKHFNRKDFDLKSGPSVSLQEMISRRVRTRQVTFVREP